MLFAGVVPGAMGEMGVVAILLFFFITPKPRVG